MKKMFISISILCSILSFSACVAQQQTCPVPPTPVVVYCYVNAQSQGSPLFIVHQVWSDGREVKMIGEIVSQDEEQRFEIVRKLNKLIYLKDCDSRIEANAHWQANPNPYRHVIRKTVEVEVENLGTLPNGHIQIMSSENLN
jgi:hypothetical protein